MFSHEAIPTRIETLLDLLRKQAKRKRAEAAVVNLLQPDGLPGLTEKSKQAKETIDAAVKLGLVDRGKDFLSLNVSTDDSRDSRAILCEAVDDRVLGAINDEPYFAPFYSFILGLGRKADEDRNRDHWVNAFRDAYPPAKESNPFNETKLTGLRRWYSYVGLGWADTREVFQCDPYHRLLRRLPRLFGKEVELPAAEFFARLATACPELDGGDIFRLAATGPAAGSRRCSLGVSRALVELHQDQVIRLHCPTDSDGWWIDEADPPRDGVYVQSDRIDRVGWLGRDAVRAGRDS